MTYQPTDAAIDAAWNSWVSNPIGGNDHEKRKLIAALIAAREADPPPSLADMDFAAELLISRTMAYMQRKGSSQPIEDAKEALLDLFRRATGEGVGE